MDAYLSNDLLITAIATVVATAWAAFKATALWQARAGVKQKIFAAIVEAVVERVYKLYVRPAKLDKKPMGDEPPKLSELERRKALDMATTLIRDKAEKLKLGNLSELQDPDLLHGKIEEAIRKAKGL